jgi:hypothetical protein
MTTKFCHHFAHNLITTTEKTEQFTENNTPAQAFIPASGGQITSHVSFVSTSVPATPRVFLRTARSGWFCLFVFVFVICIVHNSETIV